MASYFTAIPGPDIGWTLYSGKRAVGEGRDLHEAASNQNKVLVGVPVANAPTFSILLPVVETSLLRDMTYAQIEKRGLANRSIDETIFDFDILSQGNNETRIAVHLFDSPVLEDYVLPRAAGYAPSALVRHRTENGAVLWKELGQLALAIFRGGRLVHSQVLSGRPELCGGTASEINLLLLSLQADPALEDCLPATLEVYLDPEEHPDREVFLQSVNLDASFVEARGAYRKAHPRPGLTPHEVLAFRRRKKLGRQLAVGAVFLLATYFLAGTWMWKRSESNQRKIAFLTQQIELIEPDVAEIQQIETRWQEMEPAFDLKWFPVVQLSRITEALPGSGVVIREFETRGRDIYIQGQARDVQLAFRLEEDLSNLAGFEHYDWTMPKPSMNSDNTASFKIEGKPLEP